MAVDQSISDARLKDEALSELGLSEQPFVENKKLSRFSDTTTQKIRASLEQKLRFGQSLHLLTGEQGVGKSVFLSQLFKHCKNNIKPFVARGDDHFSSLAFLAAVQQQLAGEAGEYESVHDYVDELAPLFDNLADEKMAVVLAIDDAHRAPIEEIAELINLLPEFVSEGREATARLLLVGEPELATELNALADDLDDTAYEPTQTTLPAFDETRVPDYLSSRLKQAGFTDAFPFTDKAIAKIHRESGGLPGKINTSAVDYLNKVYAAPVAEAGGTGFLAALGWPLVALGAAAVGLIAWGLSMFFVSDTPDPIVSIEPTPAVTSPVAGADTPVVDANTGAGNTPVTVDNDPLAEVKSTTSEALTNSVTANNDTGSNTGNTSTIESNNEPLIVGTTDSTPQPAIVDDLLKPEDQPGAPPTDLPTNTVATVTDTAVPEQARETVTEIVEAPVEQVTGAAENAVSVAGTESSNAVDAGNNLLDTVNDTVAQRAEQIAADAQSTGVAIAESTNNEQIAQSIGQGTAVALPESVEVVIPGAANTGAANTGASSTAASTNAAADTVAAATVASNDELLDTDAAATQPDNGGIAVAVQPSLNDTNGQTLDVDSPDATPAIATPAIQRAVENERWVLFQDAGKFTVQLATSRERGYIIDLAQSLPASDPVAIYPFLTSNSKNPVFGLLSGLYNTREEALAAVAAMPQAAKQFGTWIRPIGDLQSAIKSQE